MLTDNMYIYCLQQLNSFIKYIIIAISNNQTVNNDTCVNYLWEKWFNHCFLYKWLFFFHLIWLHSSSYVNIHIIFQMLVLTILITKLLKKLLSHLFFHVYVLILAMQSWSVLCLLKMLKNDWKIFCFTSSRKSHYISFLLWSLAFWKFLYILLILSLSLLCSSNIIVSLW